MIGSSKVPTARRAFMVPLLALIVLLLSSCGEKPVASEPGGETLTVALQQTQLTSESAQEAGYELNDEPTHEPIHAAEHSAGHVPGHEAGHEAGHETHHVHDPHGGHAGHDAQEHPQPLAATPLPGTSLFHLTAEFTDQHGQPVALGDLRGNPSVVVMFYGDCDTACPLLVRSAEEIEAALPPELRSETNFVMVSFDTARDTPERLLAYAEDKNLNRDGWRWLVGTEFQTRQLATLLGVQYRDAGNGMFAHSNLVTVLDADGVPTARLEGLGVALEPAVTAVRAGARH